MEIKTLVWLDYYEGATFASSFFFEPLSHNFFLSGVSVQKQKFGQPDSPAFFSLLPNAEKMYRISTGMTFQTILFR